MTVYNREIARKFKEIADLLEIKGANPFRVRAYRNAAETVSGLSEELYEIVNQCRDLKELPGIGDDLSEKICELIETGSLDALKELREEIPPGLGEMMKLSKLGPKRIKKIYEELGIESIEGLEKAAEKNKIRGLHGLGPKTETAILAEIKRRREKDIDNRLLWAEAENITKPLLNYLKNIEIVNEICTAGSFRRRKETVGDIDILIMSKKGKEVMEHFVNFRDVSQIISQGETKSSVMLKSEIQVDLRVVLAESYGAALHYFTGSKEHNIEMRKLGQKKDLKINEYGVFKDEEQIGGKTEKDIFEGVDLPYIQPELRENSGEIEAAKNDKLPDLITLEEIKGDLQSHTEASDGVLSLEEMAEAAQKRGYQYLAITDHSKKVAMAGGLDEQRLNEQIEKIAKINAELNNFKLLKSNEVDILKDGSLDQPDSVLKKLDIVIGAIHYNFSLSREEQTKRVLKAMENPYLNIIAHPTARILGKRKPYEINLKKVFRMAKDKGCFIELNANPRRLDISSNYCKMAKEEEVKVVISTDAHSGTELANMKYGIGEARRGWLETEDVLNTLGRGELLETIKR